MIRALIFASLAVMFALFFQACAEWQPYHRLPEAEIFDCEGLFHQMDRRVSEAGVSDAGAARITGFPELRVDRFLASFVKESLTGETYATWLERLRKLDETARMIEWNNLPTEEKSSLQAHFGANVREAVNVCGHLLAEQDLIFPSRRSRLLAEVEPPDAYSTWQRFFGFYFLSRWAIVEGVWRVQREMRQPFIKPDQGLAITDQLMRYAPPTLDILGVDEVAKILQQSAANPLGIPEPSKDQLGRLFSAFAPVWAVDTENGNDRIGATRLGTDGEAYIDTREPVVYRLISHTRFGGQVLLQLNYVVWFPARSTESWLDIYAGRFDGLIWRITLRMDGKPLAYDSIHSCGCYYQIFPGEGFRVAQPMDGSEPILSPMPILGLKSGERLVIRLGARTHFIRGVTAETPMPGVKVYGWLDYDELRSLPLPDGRHRSLFDTDGLVPGSERQERFLLWPMGVPSAGAMRQWGTHAIAFLGKRHFDDPRLMEQILRPLWEWPIRKTD